MLQLIPTPIGNLEDISIRALKAFENADIFLCEDTRVTKKLLNLLKNRFNINIKSSKFISFHEHNQKNFLKNIDKDFFSQNVVYVSDAGMPGISDPGALLVKFCQENDIEYDVLPGPTALTTAYAASGFESSEFSFYAFLSHKSQERVKKLSQIMQNSHPSILYEAPHRLIKLLEEIVNIDPQRELFLAKEITKKHQKFFKNRAYELLEILKNENIKGEWVVIISPSKEKTAITNLDINDILNLDISKKEKAKLLSKITDKSVKEWYQELIKGE
ncbi:16S rRNA (cytidine(1402)-2'-O)-methyltransferase [Nitrosophilus kaiyonis]|uniref:16S rRNA (cytidine(1402)-2'-O)-methyltransferase n=1 Tax=Nitrosophilus kaiyonis TaxID=2930200 RepID=UPI00248F9E85|nr:16S rRNA (cytidine(1402)-2'-O)-methyltransferase [Nitrosophilus kaiyonis]